MDTIDPLTRMAAGFAFTLAAIWSAAILVGRSGRKANRRRVYTLKIVKRF